MNLTHVSQIQIYCEVVLKRHTYLICLKKSTWYLNSEFNVYTQVNEYYTGEFTVITIYMQSHSLFNFILSFIFSTYLKAMKYLYRMEQLLK